MPEQSDNLAIRAIVGKLAKRATLSEQELEQLQSHIDALELATAGSHHHDHDSKKVE
jgi:hypothetical protein